MEAAESADVMGIRAAARALNKSASTISRQVAAGIIPNRGTTAEPKVSLAEAKAARAVNLQPEPEVAGFAQARNVHERLKAQKTAIELAQLKGELVRRVEVEEFLAEEGAKIRDGLLRRWRAFAAELVGLTAREIEERGLAADEAVLAALAAAYES